jgi:cysteine desulfurase/selenocysteine lyase
MHGTLETKALDWKALRRDFPILSQTVHGHPLAYLDNAATSQKPRDVIQSLVRYYEHDNANVHRGIHELSNRSTAAFEAARERTTRYLNARSSREIIFTRGTTEGVNLVAQAWGNANVKAGDTILLSEMEHHSNLVPWQMLAARTGAKIVFLPVNGDEGVLDPSAIDRLLTGDVKLLALCHVSNSLGTINPVRELCARARALGVTTLVDGAQSSGHLPVDVQEIGCDFYAFSAHKMCGPTGFGVLYGREEILEQTPPWQGGGEMISSVRYTDSSWNTLPHKFEAGTPDISGAIALHAAMDYIDAIGRAEIFAHDSALTAYAWKRLSEIPGIRLFGPAQNRGALVSFLLPDVHAHDLVTMADQYGIALRGGHHCCQPLMRKLGVASTARASFYFYNTHEEIDQLTEALHKILHFFRREL